MIAFCLQWRNEGLARRVLMAALVATFIWPLSNVYKVAHAQSEEAVLLNLALYGPVLYSDLVLEAESLVSDEITRQFGGNANLTDIEVMVLGNRNGDIIPILETSVSRDQWQETPQVSAWTRYYNVAHSLLQRHDPQQPQPVAAAPARSTPSPAGITSTQFDRAYDAGRLRGQVVQDYLNDVD